MKNRILIVLLFIILIVACATEQPKKVSLQNRIALPQPTDDDVIRIGVGSMISPKITLVKYEDMIGYIGEKLGKKVRMAQASSYAEMNALIKTRAVDAAFVCGGPYVIGKKSFEMELVAVPQIENSTNYYSAIIVHKNSTINRFAELKGKRFAFADPDSNTGFIAPSFALWLINETPKSFFKDYIFTGSHDNSIEAVATDLVDGAAVDNLIWNYLDKRSNKFTQKTRIITELGPYCSPPLVTHPDASPEFKKKLKSIMLGMHNDAKGREILNALDIERFVDVGDSCYDSIRAMVEKIKPGYT